MAPSSSQADAAPDTIDAYIASCAPAVRPLLAQVRAAVQRAAPGAQECISYRIPAFRQDGVLVYFAAFQKHIGFYPPVRGDARLVKAVARYAGEKGNLRFPLDEPLPLALIEDITRLRLAQDAQRVAARKKGKVKKA